MTDIAVAIFIACFIQILLLLGIVLLLSTVHAQLSRALRTFERRAQDAKRAAMEAYFDAWEALETNWPEEE